MEKTEVKKPFQFLHRILLLVELYEKQFAELNFQFLHRILREGNVEYYDLLTFDFQFLHRILQAAAVLHTRARVQSHLSIPSPDSTSVIRLS